MTTKKKFSRFIAQYLMIFMGMSFIIVAIAVYFIRVHDMDKSSNAGLDRSQRGFSEILSKQLDYAGKGLGNVVSDYLIRDFLLHNDILLLSDMMRARYSFEERRAIFILDNRNNLIIPDLPINFIAVRPLLEKFNTEGKQFSAFQKAGNNVFISIFSTPMMNLDNRIGTGYLLYDISKDKLFWELIHGSSMMLTRILMHDGGEHLYDLETGEEISVPDKSRIRLLSNASKNPIRDIFKDEILLPVTGFPNLYYAADNKPFEERKRSLRTLLVSLCVFILILTLLVSYFISKAVSRPLERMAVDANEIAHNPTNKFLNEERTEYSEFRQLSGAFNQVLSTLFAAQEELKSKARKDLEASEERYRLTVEAAPDAIVITRFKDGLFLHVNNAFEKIFGYSRDEAIGKTALEISIYVDVSVREKIMDKLKGDDEINRLEIKFRCRDGSVADCLMSCRKIKYQGEDCIISIVLDHTEKKKAEEEKRRLEGALQRASKMEAIGTMAGGVAHDLNNILSGLVGYPELLLMDLPSDSRLRKPILTIQRSGEKAAAIVQDMLTLARRGVSVTDVVNLNKIIIEYLKSPEHKKIMSYNPAVRLNIDLDPNLLNIAGSDLHLSKTLMNLISNAIEAMHGVGDINISTKNEYIDLPIKGYDDVIEGDYVVLTVSDNGTGISPEDQERIFEPFYTKKKMGRSGTGLGMAVVWGTVKDHDGYIDLQSDSGKGATFKLYFPVTRRDLAKDDSELSVEAYMGKGESVLVVDDVKEQREIASSMLTRLGYSVVSVSSGEAAVEYMTQNSADILVLDMIMDPGIDGLETYKRILTLNPVQKVIVASGFSETDRVREAQRLGAGAYVKKPYLMKNIGPAVRKELDKRLSIED